MSTPPVPNDPQSGEPQPGQPRYGENAPQYGQNPPQYGQQPGQDAPQYGQNPPQYGQQPGQDAPQYGQNPPQAPAWNQQPAGQPPYGQSPYAQSPYGQPEDAGTNGVPQLVTISFWLIIASAVIYVISMFTGLGQLDDPAMRGPIDDQLEGSGVSYEDVKGFMTGSLVVFAIIGVALYLLVAFFVRKGKNWARILGTVFAALSIIGLFGIPSIGTLGTVAGIVAIVLLYLPKAAPYFRKQQPFANPYGGSPYGR
ncbi:hypothetical protein ASF72_06495 [Arthrobacter sp. Leaf141]|uniref:Yip1 family protein n=1 Tax=Arthrobacter sp. Leaf141 TaxID=1736273 RepID=UPI0006FF332F|nr:hypothetical protein [Arthrobacter sp. Leaf141]KQR02848.1 hypothetical protein ASF72_06495 [Arthrobacter sp. Leaf141]